MRSSWLYFATRSLRLGAPVLIWQVFSATARSAIVVSSVSPERWEVISGVACVVCHFDRFEGLRYGADLIQLDQD